MNDEQSKGAEIVYLAQAQKPQKCEVCGEMKELRYGMCFECVFGEGVKFTKCNQGGKTCDDI